MKALYDFKTKRTLQYTLSRGLMLSAFILMLSFVLAGCGPTTFIISKDSKAYYLGRKSEVLHRLLCQSGDFASIISETSMPEELKSELYRFTCTDERSKERVIALYNFLTPQEKEDFKSVFRNHGYTINYVPC